jgi:hypothetical protein
MTRHAITDLGLPNGLTHDQSPFSRIIWGFVRLGNSSQYVLVLCLLVYLEAYRSLALIPHTS